MNIALVDIGAGTSDISVTRDGSIIAYGMIPLAGDEITELIVQSYLVDFNTAEQIKLSSGMDDQVTYKDIMMIEHTIPSKDVWKLTEPVVDKMTTEVAAKIKELNGDRASVRRLSSAAAVRSTVTRRCLPRSWICRQSV